MWGKPTECSVDGRTRNRDEALSREWLLRVVRLNPRVIRSIAVDVEHQIPGVGAENLPYPLTNKPVGVRHVRLA